MLCSEKLSNYPWLSFLVTLQTVLPGTLLAESGLGLIQWIYGFFPSRACLYLLFLERHIALFLKLSHEFRRPEEEMFVAGIWIKGAILEATSTKWSPEVKSCHVRDGPRMGKNEQTHACTPEEKIPPESGSSRARRTLWLPSLRSERSPNFNGILFTRTESSESDSSPPAPWR